MRHEKVNYNKQYAEVGDTVAIYPAPWRGKAFIGKVEKLVRNKFGRISYKVNGKMYFAEELFPGKDDLKIRLRLDIK